MNKKKIIGLAGAVVVCILVFVFIVIRGKSPNPAENPVDVPPKEKPSRSAER